MTYFLYWLINDLALKLLIWISRQFHTRRKCQAKFYQILPKHCYYFASDTPTIAVEPHSFRKFSLALEVWATHYPKVSDDAGWLSTTRFPVCMDPKLDREKSSWYGLKLFASFFSRNSSLFFYFWTWYYQINMHARIIKNIMASQKFGYYTTHHYPKLLQLYYLKYDLPHKRTFADAYVDTRWLSNRVKFVLAYYHRLWSGAWKINWVLVLLSCQEFERERTRRGTRI